MDDWEKRMHIMEVRLDEHLLDIEGRQVKAPSSFQVIESVRVDVVRAKSGNGKVATFALPLGFANVGHESNTLGVTWYESELPQAIASQLASYHTPVNRLLEGGTGNLLHEAPGLPRGGKSGQ